MVQDGTIWEVFLLMRGGVEVDAPLRGASTSTPPRINKNTSQIVPSCTILKTRFAYVAYNIWDRCNYYVLLNQETEFIHLSFVLRVGEKHDGRLRGQDL